MAYNRWVQGIASREQSATKVTLGDVLDGKKATPLDNKPSLKDKPLHPVLTQTPMLVGSIMTDLSNMEAKIKSALMSNMGHNPRKKRILLELLALTNHGDRTIRRMISRFERLEIP